MTKKQLYVLGLVTLVGFSAIGIAVIEFWLGKSFKGVLLGGDPIQKQLIAGALFGLAAAFIAKAIIGQPFMDSVRNFFDKLIGKLDLSFADILFISLCAGIGEEILFRGAIQPLLGVWITAVLFIVLHGYLNPFNWRISVYGVVMCLVIVVIGYMAEHIGLVSAITAHFTIDLVLLLGMDDKETEEESSEEEW